jgi:hypothetical protein
MVGLEMMESNPLNHKVNVSFKTNRFYKRCIAIQDDSNIMPTVMQRVRRTEPLLRTNPCTDDLKYTISSIYLLYCIPRTTELREETTRQRWYIRIHFQQPFDIPIYSESIFLQRSTSIMSRSHTIESVQTQLDSMIGDVVPILHDEFATTNESGMKLSCYFVRIKILGNYLA